MPLLLFGHIKASDRRSILIYSGESGSARAAAGAAVVDQFESFTAVDHPQTYPMSRSKLVVPEDYVPPELPTAPAGSASSAALEKLQFQLNFASEDNARLEDEVSSLRSEIESLRSAAAAYIAELEGSRIAVQALTGELDKIKSELAFARDSNAALTNENENLAQELAAKSALLDSLPPAPIAPLSPPAPEAPAELNLEPAPAASAASAPAKTGRPGK